MKSIQYYGPQNIKYEEVMVKPPQEGEIVVKIMSAMTFPELLTVSAAVLKT